MNCAVCEKIKDKKAMIVYEDADFMAALPAKPASGWHIRLFPKKHCVSIDELNYDEFVKIYALSNAFSSGLFEIAQAHGTNILLTEQDSHLAVDIIARKQDDGLNFLWNQKQATQPELEEVLSKIKDKAFKINLKEEKKPQVLEEKKPEVQKPMPEDNYYIKNLTRRLP